MSETKCQGCGASTTNGLALCERCRIAAAVILEFLPIYFANLSRWRPGRAGSRPVPGSREPRDPSTHDGSDHVQRALNEAGADLTGWARCFEDDRGVAIPTGDDEAATITAVCVLFAEHTASIATLPWAGAFLEGIAHHETKLRGLTESVVPGWYAGACRQCGFATYVIPGLTWVKCETCGVRTYARDHLDTILDEARGWVARPMRLAEALVCLVDTEQSVPRLHKRISKWGERKQVEALRASDADGDPIGPKRYRLGEVLDRLTAEGQTRTAESPSTKAS